MIEIRDLFVSFGGVRALNGISVDLNDPIVGIIGPNGAGKTTLLNVFSGFVVPQRGLIRGFGADLLAMAPHVRARWGLRRSFQTEQVVDDLSAADNIRVILDPLRRSREEKRGEIAEALRYVGLLDKWDVLGGELNNFERRLIEIAKTLVGSPKVILLDEPGAGLRPHEVEKLKETVVGIEKKFCAMTLLIDHDVALIASICHSALVLDFGELIASGPTAAVLKNPKVNAAYLGTEEVA